MKLDSPESIEQFEDLAWLFSCDNRNVGIIRLTFSEAALLWKAVKATAGTILETGRRFGGSTSLLAAASAERKMFSIDIVSVEHPRVLEFLRRAGNKERIELLVDDSRKPLPGQSYGLIFIDGDHSFEGVRADILAHWNALRAEEGRPALGAFHDALPNENFAWRKKKKRWQLFRRGRSEKIRGYKPAINSVCHALIDSGAAESWGAAGSMWVLRKLADLPSNFLQGKGTPNAVKNWEHLSESDLH